MDFPYGETATRLRATAEADPYSSEDTTLDWGTPSSLTIPACAFDPGGSLEPVEAGRTAVITQPTVYAPPDADVLAGDRITIRDRTWEVDGDPALFRNPFTGWEPGLVIKLKAVTG